MEEKGREPGLAPYEAVKDRLVLSVRNKADPGAWKAAVWPLAGDMVVICRDIDGDTVSPADMEAWGVTADELYADALENTMARGPAAVTVLDAQSASCFLYSEDSANRAAAILYPGAADRALKRAVSRSDADSAFVLASSDGFTFMPDTGDLKVKEVKAIMRVSGVHDLSERVYRYGPEGRLEEVKDAVTTEGSINTIVLVLTVIGSIALYADIMTGIPDAWAVIYVGAAVVMAAYALLMTGRGSYWGWKLKSGAVLLALAAAAAFAGHFAGGAAAVLCRITAGIANTLYLVWAARIIDSLVRAIIYILKDDD